MATQKQKELVVSRCSELSIYTVDNKSLNGYHVPENFWDDYYRLYRNQARMQVFQEIVGQGMFLGKKDV